MLDLMNQSIVLFLILAFILLALAIGLYVFLGIFLNRFNNKEFGRSTAKAWIPIVHFYLLGKLAFNKAVGWLLLIFVIVCTLLTSTTTVNINGVETSTSILTGTAATIVDILQFMVVLSVLIYAIIKYKKQ